MFSLHDISPRRAILLPLHSTMLSYGQRGGLVNQDDSSVKLAVYDVFGGKKRWTLLSLPLPTPLPLPI